MKSDFRLSCARIFFLLSVELVGLSGAALPQIPDARDFNQGIRKELSVEDLLSMLYLKVGERIALSPDGQLVAYTLEDRRKKEREDRTSYGITRTGAPAFLQGCDVWIADTKTGISKSVTGGRGNSWGPVWSPDGRMLAFNSDRSGMVHLWVWERSSGELRQLSDAVTRMLDVDRIEWSPDGTQILIRLLPEGMQLGSQSRILANVTPENRFDGKPVGLTVRIYRSVGMPHPILATETTSLTDDTAQVGVRRADLALVDLRSGSVRRIARRVLSYWAGFSPDGERVAFADLKPQAGPIQSFQPHFDLAVVSVDTGDIRVVAKDVAMTAGNVAWSPDGRWLSYSTSDDRVSGLAIIVSASGDRIRRMASGGSAPAQFGYSAPLWDESGSFVYALGDGALWRMATSDGSVVQVARIPEKTIGAILARANNRQIWSLDDGHSAVVVAQDAVTAKCGFFKVGLSTGTASTLLEEQKQYGGYGGVMAALKTAVSKDGKLIVFAAEDAQHSEELWALETNSHVVRQLTRINPQIDPRLMGQQRVIAWTGRDGEQHQGLLLLPSNYQNGRSYPLLLYVYERSMQYANTFGLTGSQFWNLQLYVTRGYAVLYPDALVFGKGEPMRRIADIVIPGIAKAIDLGIADATNIGVIGHSSGGYMAMSLIVQYPFKAAVVSAGAADLFSLYGIPLEENGSTFGMPWIENQMGMNGSPWEFREQYLQNSPWFFLDRATAAVFLLVGSEDGHSVAQMDQAFVGLQRLGKEAQYAKYDGETHAEEWWSYSNKFDAAQRVIAWLDGHLKRPAGEKADQPLN